MTDTRPVPPPRDVHTWFSLSYAEYLVLGREKLNRTETGRQISDMLVELFRAYDHLHVPQYRVTLGEWWYVGEMNDDQLAAAGIQINTPSGEAEPEVTYTDGVNELTGQDYGFVPAPNGAQPADRYVVVNRTLLQSMPQPWQQALVAKLERFSEEMTERADDAGPSKDYKVQPGTWDGGKFNPLHRDPVPHYSRGRTRVEPRL